MDNQWWSWILTVVGVAGFILAGRKVWWSWYINLGCQALWFIYAFATEQYGFIFAAAVYTVVFTKNAVAWTKEHFGYQTPKEKRLAQAKENNERYLRVKESYVRKRETRRRFDKLLTTTTDPTMRLEYLVVTRDGITYAATLLIDDIDASNEQVRGTDLSTNEHRTLDWSKDHGGWTYFERPDVSGVFKHINEGR